MRLDKFLKVSRLVKRRAVAKALCDEGKVRLAGKAAKASSQVAPGDVIEIDFGERVLAVRVLAVPEEKHPLQRGSAPIEVLKSEFADWRKSRDQG